MKNKNSGCLSILFPFLKSKETNALPYSLGKSFLSPAELSFYKVLSSMIGTKAVIQSKVGLKDIFQTNSKSYHNKISQKHVDFLICKTETMKPIMGIELDDASHKQNNRQERDQFIDSVFAICKLPLLHITVQREYNPEKLASLIKNKLKSN